MNPISMRWLLAQSGGIFNWAQTSVESVSMCSHPLPAPRVLRDHFPVSPAAPLQLS